MRGDGTTPDLDPVDDIVAEWQVQRPDVDVSALHVFGRLHRCYLRYHAELSELFDEFGINMASFDVLAALRRSGRPYRMTAGQLAESSLVSTGGVTLRVDRCQKAGLVVRERDADDRRVVYCRLTDEGLALVDRLAGAHFNRESLMLHGLGPDEQGELARLLSKLEGSIATRPAAAVNAHA